MDRQRTPVKEVTPIELIVGVDDMGSLYTCTATVGDTALQNTLQQALNTSFGEQAGICELSVQDGVATSVANMPTDVLPNLLTVLRSVPFARLQLQNDRLTVEAPDSMLLQQLVADISTLVPNIAVDSTAPLPLPNNGNGDTTYGMAGTEGVNSQFDGGAVSNNQYNNNGFEEYQATDDDTNDRVIPAPMPNDNRFNATPNNTQNNLPNNTQNNNQNNVSNNLPSSNSNNRPSGPISIAEVDDMASSVIVAEPAQVRQ